MAVFNEPTKWQTSLVNSGDANTIPQSTPAGTGEASFEDGFPQITQVPIGAGGIAPDRKDFNGLFKTLGDWIFFAQNGGVPAYSTNFDYVFGRVVLYNGNIYKCIQANGASSTVVAPDSVDPDYLGSDYWKDIENQVDIDNVMADLALKADKDFSNVTAPTQAFKDMSIDWSMPDYSAGVSVTLSSTYTATYDQLLVIEGLFTNGETLVATINSKILISLAAGGGATTRGNAHVFLNKDDVLNFITLQGTYTATAYPLKGAN